MRKLYMWERIQGFIVPIVSMLSLTVMLTILVVLLTLDKIASFFWK